MERRVPIHSTGLPCSATSHSTPSSSMEASTTTSSSSSSPRLLVFPHEQDVLLGRGKGSYEWNGNRVFARLISSHVLVYEAATGNKHKIQITQNIVALVQQMGGRFLKQVQPGTRMPSDNQNHSTTTTATNNNNSTTSDLPCCEIVSDAEARRKVSQALRHRRRLVPQSERRKHQQTNRRRQRTTRTLQEGPRSQRQQEGTSRARNHPDTHSAIVSQPNGGDHTSSNHHSAASITVPAAAAPTVLIGQLPPLEQEYYSPIDSDNVLSDFSLVEPSDKDEASWMGDDEHDTEDDSSAPPFSSCSSEPSSTVQGVEM